MATIVSGTSNTKVSITGSTPVIVAPDAVLNVTGNAIDIYGSADPNRSGSLTVVGLVHGTVTGIFSDGHDYIRITQTGSVSSANNAGGDAIYISGTDSVVHVAGYVYGEDFGIVSYSGSTEVVISKTGVVQGGSNTRGLEAAPHSAAIELRESDNVLINEGSILADINPDNGYRIAVMNANYSGSFATGVNEDSLGQLEFYNTGYVLGDIYFAAGDDLYDGRATGDVDGIIDLGIGADTLFGGDGFDSVDGGDGDDNIRTYGGDDSVEAGEGADFVAGGSGDDTLLGEGDDDTVRGNDGDDSIQAGAGADYVAGGLGDDTLLGEGDDDTVLGNDGDDSIDGGGGADVVSGGSGDDTLLGDDGLDTLKGGGGDDTLVGGRDDDVLMGNNGDDVLTGAIGVDTLMGQSGNDTLHGGSWADLLRGGSGDDSLQGDGGNDTLRGESSDDHADGGAGRDLIEGGSGSDTLIGGSENDTIDGGPGEDTLVGGAGRDTLTGGTGFDTYEFADGFGADLIQDFDGSDHEKIDLSAVAAITDFTDLVTSHLSQNARGVVIDAGNGNTITIESFNLSDLDSGDFIF